MKGARTELKVLALLQQDIQQRFSLRSLSSTTFILSFQRTSSSSSVRSAVFLSRSFLFESFLENGKGKGLVTVGSKERADPSAVVISN
jgi:hypothetical protein